MLRIIQVGNSLPYSLPVDQTTSFQPGNICQLTVIGNQIVGTKSNGTAPLGIIDDVKTNAFTAVSWNEEIIVSAVGVPGPGGQLITTADIKAELDNPNIIPNSFISLDVDVQLIPRNGVVVFPAGTVLNFDETGGGVPNAIRTVVNYTYTIPNIVGDDSTSGSQRVTVWFQRMIAESDMYDSTAVYPVNANLYVNESGLLTTKQPAANYASVGIVMAPPSLVIGSLQFLWW